MNSVLAGIGGTVFVAVLAYGAVQATKGDLPNFTAPSPCQEGLAVLQDQVIKSPVNIWGPSAINLGILRDKPEAGEFSVDDLFLISVASTDGSFGNNTYCTYEIRPNKEKMQHYYKASTLQYVTTQFGPMLLQFEVTLSEQNVYVKIVPGSGKHL